MVKVVFHARSSTVKIIAGRGAQMDVRTAGGFRVSSSSKSAARAHLTIPTVISTQCMVSSALSDCGGLRNSTVPQVLCFSGSMLAAVRELHEL